MYDDEGEPTWYFSAGPMLSPTQYEGDWLEFAGGQTLGGPYLSPTYRSLGRVSVNFAGYDNATITFSENGSTKSAATKSIMAGPQSSRTTHAGPLIPQAPWANSSDFPPYFDCRIVREINTISEAGTTGWFTSRSTITFDVLFQLGPRPTGRYTVDGSSTYSYVYDDYDTSNECRTHGSKSGIYPLSGKLDISPYLWYSGRVFDNIGSTVTLQTTSCIQSQPPDVSSHVLADVQVGTPYSRVQNVNPASTALAAYSLTGWTFHAESDGSNVVVKYNCSSYPYRPPS